MNPETHPEYVYVVAQGAGIVSEGRPIRGNFYCYKLLRHHAGAVRTLFDNTGSTSSTSLAYLARHEVPWSHRVDDRGREA